MAMRETGRNADPIGRGFGFLSLSIALILATAATLPAAQTAVGNSPQDRFLQIYVEIQDADRAAGQGYYTKAAAQYKEAQSALEELHQANPRWERQIVEYRLGYVRKQLADMEKRMAGLPTAPTTVPSSPVEGRLQEVEDKLAKLEASRENNADKAAVNRQMVELRDLLGKLQGELSDLKAARTKEIAEEAATQAEIGKIGSLSAEVDSLNVQVTKLKKNRAKAEERARLEKRLQDLQGQLAHAKTVREKAKEQQAVQAKMKELSGQVAALQAELSRTKAAQETAAQTAGGEEQGAERVVQLEGAVQQLENQLAAAQKEQQRLQAESPAAAQTQEVVQLRAQMERIQAEVARMEGRKEIRRLETTTTANSSEVAALKDRVRKLEEELIRTRQQQERLLNSVAGQRTNLQVRVEELQAELDRVEAARPPSPAPAAGVGGTAGREAAVPPPRSQTPWSASTGHRLTAAEQPGETAEEAPEEQPSEQPPETAQKKEPERKKTAEAKKKQARHRRNGSAVEEEVVRSLNRVRRQIANLIGG